MKKREHHTHKWVKGPNNQEADICTRCGTIRTKGFRKDGRKNCFYKRSKVFIEELRAIRFSDGPATYVCSKCKKEKPLNEFRENKSEVCGVTYRCKECLSDDYYDLRDYHINRHKKYRKDNPEKVMAYIETVPHKQKKAGQMIRSRLLYNTVDRPDTCSSCGNDCKPDAHHADYDKPLDVTWLCRPCHMKLHRDQRTYG